MISSFEQIQILYEIALTIGEGQNLKEASSKALSVYLRKLNCSSGAIIRINNIDENCWAETIHSIPARIEKNEIFSNFMKNIATSPKECLGMKSEIKLPAINHHEENKHSYVQELPGFGFIFMVKTGESLPEDLFLTLSPLNKKLADALNSFITKETINLQSMALESSSNAIMITDSGGYIQWVNKAWTLLNGFSREESIGQYSNIMRSSNHDEAFFKEMWECLLMGKVWYGTVVNSKKNGESYTAEINITPVFSHSGVITNFIGISHDVTNRKKAEEQLQASEAHLRTLVETIPDLVWLKNTEGVYLACNPKFEEFFGASAEDIIGRTDYDFVPKEIADSFRIHDLTAMDAGKPMVNEEEVVFANDGHRELLETIKTPMLDKSGEVVGVLGVARNITERKLAEEALMESKERFKEMANLLPQPIWETDMNGFFTYANRAGFEVLGYTPDDIEKGLHFTEVIAPHDRQRILHGFWRKINNETTFDYQYDCIKKDGEIFSSLVYTSPIKKNEKIIGVRGITLDISQLKEKENTLKYLSGMQDVLISISTRYINVEAENIDDAISNALKEVGEFVSADRSYIFDYDFEKQTTSNTYEWCGQGIDPQIEFLQDVPLDALPQWVESHLKGEPIYIPDVFALPIDDGVRAILEPQDIKSLIAVPMKHGSEIVGFIGFDSVRNYHVYSEKEKSILEVFAQIVVNLQMRSNAERELKLAKEKAEKAEQAQFKFLSTMSHEIRTPLNAVVGITNILLMDSPKPEQLENLNTLKFSSLNLLSIINDILDYNKLVSGNILLENVDFSINELLKRMHISMNTIANTKGIKLSYTVDSMIPDVLVGDSNRFLQIINNLVSNAIKFTKKGIVNVNLKLVEEMGDEAKIYVEVRDTGIGIPREKFELIFEDFKQSSSSITREFGGTGLGLPIVRKLLNVMGTDINLESIVGIGSVFSFSIFFKKGNLDRLNEYEESISYDGSLNGKKILLVEDNKINQMVAIKFLAEWNCEVEIADNGQIALSKFAKSSFDAVLMDLQMPVMDGYTATREIRKLEAQKERKTPIIALSASALGEVETRARKYGLDDFLTKPFVPEVLFKTLVKFTR